MALSRCSRQIAHPSHSTPQISVTYQGWDQSKTVLAGQLCGHMGPGAGRGAHCRAQAAAVLALEHKDGSLRGHWVGLSVSYQGWDQSKTVLAGQQLWHVGPGAARGAHCRAQAAAVLALEMRHHNSVVVSRVLMVGNPDIPDDLDFLPIAGGLGNLPLTMRRHVVRQLLVTAILN